MLQKARNYFKNLFMTKAEKERLAAEDKLNLKRLEAEERVNESKRHASAKYKRQLQQREKERKERAKRLGATSLKRINPVSSNNAIRRCLQGLHEYKGKEVKTCIHCENVYKSPSMRKLNSLQSASKGQEVFKQKIA